MIILTLHTNGYCYTSRLLSILNYLLHVGHLSRVQTMTYEEIIKLVDERIDMQTDIIMESDWFDEKVQEAVKSYLETNQL